MRSVCTALTGSEWSALQAACNWHETGQLKGILAELPESFSVTIVEDTLGGIRSVRTAGEILRDAGLDVTVHAFGLTSGSTAKSAAFEDAGVPHCSDWEMLMELLGL